MSAKHNLFSSEDIPNVRSELNSPFYRPRNFESDVLKRAILDVFYNYKWLLFGIFNIISVVVLTLTLSSMLAPSCVVDDNVYVSPASVFCTPFAPVARVVVDVDLDKDTHCYSSKSCVTLGSGLGAHAYSFILGAYGFVYVQLGYQCRLDEGVPTLRIRMPVDSIYNGHDFMAARRSVEKFTEVLREGLECGMVLHNYTLSAEGCGSWNTWCTNVLQQILTEDVPGGVPGPKREFQVEHVRGNTSFNPLDIGRVYNYHYQLKVCGHS